MNIRNNQKTRAFGLLRIYFLVAISLLTSEICCMKSFAVFAFVCNFAYNIIK